MGQPFLPPYLSKSVVEAEAESFSLSAPGRNPQGVCHILPVSALGSVVALKRCFHSPRSLLQCLLPYSYHLLKVIIFLFLIPEAPGIQRNTLCGKGSDLSGVQPYRSHPSCACLCWVPGNTTAKSTYTSEVFHPGRQNTLNRREGGETRM